MPSPSSSRAVKRITTHNRTNNNIITATDNAMCKKKQSRAHCQNSVLPFFKSFELLRLFLSIASA